MDPLTNMSPKAYCPECSLDYPNAEWNRQAFEDQTKIVCEGCGTIFKIANMSTDGRLFSTALVEEPERCPCAPLGGPCIFDTTTAPLCLWCGRSLLPVVDICDVYEIADMEEPP